MAQLSFPDMRLPIDYCLSYPERSDVAYGRIDWSEVGRLDFEPPDPGVFRCLGIAYEAGRRGGAAPAWLNAANEVAVAAFLDGRLSWPGIAEVVEETLQQYEDQPLPDVGAVLAADASARRRAEGVVAARERA